MLAHLHHTGIPTFHHRNQERVQQLPHRTAQILCVFTYIRFIRSQPSPDMLWNNAN